VTTQTIKIPNAVPTITATDPSKECRKGSGTGCGGWRFERHRNERKAIRKIVSVAGNQAHARTIPPRQSCLCRKRGSLCINEVC
jgi:hypothetical protein